MTVFNRFRCYSAIVGTLHDCANLIKLSCFSSPQKHRKSQKENKGFLHLRCHHQSHLPLLADLPGSYLGGRDIVQRKHPTILRLEGRMHDVGSGIGTRMNQSFIPRQGESACLPEWIHLDVVGRLTPSKDGKQEFTTSDLHFPT
jgi:hypothetical protein